MKPNNSARGNSASTHHNYSAKMDTSSEGLKRKDPFSPLKSQPSTKMRDLTTDDGTRVVLEAIKQRTDKVDGLGTQIQQNSVMLASMAKAVEFNAAEIKDRKTQLKVPEQEVAAIKKDNRVIGVLELERYKRRWNLRIRGLKEKEGENTRDLVANLLIKISPPHRHRTSTASWIRLIDSADKRRTKPGRSSSSLHTECTGICCGR